MNIDFSSGAGVQPVSGRVNLHLQSCQTGVCVLFNGLLTIHVPSVGVLT